MWCKEKALTQEDDADDLRLASPDIFFAWKNAAFALVCLLKKIFNVLFYRKVMHILVKSEGKTYKYKNSLLSK